MLTNNTKDYVDKVFKNRNKVLTSSFSFAIIKIDKGNINNKKGRDQYEQQKAYHSYVSMEIK